MYQSYRYCDLAQKSKAAGIVFDVLVTGVTGAGKSTTLNTLFQKEVSSVGTGVDPETQTLDSYRFNPNYAIQLDKAPYIT